MLEIRAGQMVRIVVGESELRITRDLIAALAAKVLLNTPIPAVEGAVANDVDAGEERK